MHAHDRVLGMSFKKIFGTFCDGQAAGRTSLPNPVGKRELTGIKGHVQRWKRQKIMFFEMKKILLVYKLHSPKLKV